MNDNGSNAAARGVAEVKDDDRAATVGLRPGTVLDDRYEIAGLLDGQSGGMGCVYLATDRRLSRSVVIKVLRRELYGSDDRLALKRRFAAEPIAAASIDHPNIIDIYDSRCEGDLFYFVMPRLSGAVNLADRVAEAAEQGEWLGLDELREYAIQAAAGLWAAHAHGIIHRDIKPQNLLVRRTESGSYCLVIIDFGVSRRLAAPITRTGTALGTPAFFAPEYVQQVLGKKVETDHRIDLFALGVTLYFAATGRLPFEGEDEGSIYRSICTGEPAPPSAIRPELPVGWDVVIMRLMQKDPAARYQTAGELHADLAQVDALEGPVPETTAVQSAILPPNEVVDANFLPDVSGTVDGWCSPSELTNAQSQSAEEPEPLPGATAVSDGASSVSQRTVAGAEPTDHEAQVRCVCAGDEASVAQAPQRQDEEEGAPLTGSAAQFAEAVADKPRGRLGMLPRATRAAIGIGAGAAALLLVATVVRMGAEDSDRAEPVAEPPAVESPVAGASDVTPAELLREQAQAKQRALLAAAGIRSDGPPQQERAVEPAGDTRNAKPGRRRSKAASRPEAGQSQEQGKGPRHHATLASARVPAEGPGSASEPKPATGRKDVSRVIRFYRPAASTKAAGAADAAGASRALGIPTGTAVRARLVTPVKLSGAQRSAMAVAELVAPLELDEVGEVLPAGTRFVGQATTVSVAERARVEIAFSTLVLPDRSERRISAVATSGDGAVGISALVTKQDDRALANLGEGAADVVDGLLDALPGRSVTRRFSADGRQDARELRRQSVTVSVAKGVELVLRFVRSV